MSAGSADSVKWTEDEFRVRVRGCLAELEGERAELVALWPRVWSYIRRGLAEEAAAASSAGAVALPGPS